MTGAIIRTVTQRSLREHVGIVTQDTFLFHDTIYENIRYGRLDATEAEIHAAAKLAYAHDFILAQPEGYDTIVGDKGCLLSGGQQQRLAIARALLKNAPVLLLDEATSALDSESERMIQAALERLAHGRTVIAIAHRLSTILNSDSIVVMSHGRIVDIGPHATLLDTVAPLPQTLPAPVSPRRSGGRLSGVALGRRAKPATRVQRTKLLPASFKRNSAACATSLSPRPERFTTMIWSGFIRGATFIACATACADSSAGNDPFRLGERAERRQRFAVGRVVVLRAADVAQIAVLRPDRGVVQSGGNRMRQLDLPILIGQQPGLRSLQHAQAFRLGNAPRAVRAQSLRRRLQHPSFSRRRRGEKGKRAPSHCFRRRRRQ